MATSFTHTQVAGTVAVAGTATEQALGHSAINDGILWTYLPASLQKTNSTTWTAQVVTAKVTAQVNVWLQSGGKSISIV